MIHVTRRSLLGGIALAAGAGTLAGTVASPAMAQLQAEVYVPIEPPPPRVEVVPVLPRERVEREFWVPGHWRWNGREYVWAEGHHVVRPRAGAAWVPGRWERRPGGWLYIEGHWG
jgi:hypothetical protein